MECDVYSMMRYYNKSSYIVFVDGNSNLVGLVIRWNDIQNYVSNSNPDKEYEQIIKEEIGECRFTEMPSEEVVIEANKLLKEKREADKENRKRKEMEEQQVTFDL